MVVRAGLNGVRFGATAAMEIVGWEIVEPVP